MNKKTTPKVVKATQVIKIAQLNHNQLLEDILEASSNEQTIYISFILTYMKKYI
jgi:hypothetical protein